MELGVIWIFNYPSLDHLKLLTKDLSQPKVVRISRFSTSNPTNRKTIYGLGGSINGVPKMDGLWGKIPSINGWWLEWLVYPYDLGNPHIYADWFQVRDFSHNFFPLCLASKNHTFCLARSGPSLGWMFSNSLEFCQDSLSLASFG